MTELCFWTYMIANHRGGALYIGHTDNLYSRMEQHVQGEFEGFSKRYGLKHLVWFQEFGSRHEAFCEERRLKNWTRDWKLDLIETFNPNWVDIHKVNYWPLPDKNRFPSQFDECLKHSLVPAVRRDERKFMDEYEFLNSVKTVRPRK